MCLFWAKHNVDQLLWDKHEGDGKQLTPTQRCARPGLPFLSCMLCGSAAAEACWCLTGD